MGPQADGLQLKIASVSLEASDAAGAEATFAEQRVEKPTDDRREEQQDEPTEGVGYGRAFGDDAYGERDAQSEVEHEENE